MNRRRTRHWRTGEELEAKYCLSSIAFLQYDIECCTADFAVSVAAADLDEDGDIDVLSASDLDGKVAWYENIGGNGHYGKQKPISIVSSPSSVSSGDLDGDGDSDVLVAAENGLFWLENDGNGAFSWHQLLSEGWFQSVAASDLDSDGDVDIIAAWYDDDSRGRIVWYENMAGNGNFNLESRIIANERARFISAADIDGDGDQDVLFTGLQAEIRWIDNLGGAATFETRLLPGIRGARAAFAADLDGDKDVDLITAYGENINWHENVDGKGMFGQPKVVFSNESVGGEAGNVLALFAADVDGDGDVDVLSTSDDYAAGVTKVSWYENQQDSDTFGQQIAITPPRVRSTDIVDLDGDGDLDVISVFTDERYLSKIAWYENLDGDGSMSGRQEIIEEVYAWSVRASDLDGDGDMDILSGLGSYDSGMLEWQIAWYENIGGGLNIGQRRVITTLPTIGSFFSVADLDGDGDPDVISKSADELIWHENLNGATTFERRGISSVADQIWPVFAIDFDGDSDLDVISVNHDSNRNRTKVVWFDNVDSTGTLWQQKEILNNLRGRPSSFFVADLDGDGDADVLSAYNRMVAWYENLDGSEISHEPRVITAQADRAGSVSAVDLDGDGDLDVLSGSWGSLTWYENLGEKMFDEHQLSASFGAGSVRAAAADLDGDGQLDILSSTFRDGRLTWFENRVIGDSNDDGIFNSSDLTAVFSADKFEDGIPDNATFDEGDWNQDGEFDSADLVLAFQSGNYVSAVVSDDFTAVALLADKKSISSISPLKRSGR